MLPKRKIASNKSLLYSKFSFGNRVFIENLLK